MKSKSFFIMLILGVGIPAIIIYNIFFQTPPATYGSIEGFAEYERQILSLNSTDYEVLSVIDEGALVRVNIRANNPASDRLDARIQTTNALYDVQSLLGKELSVSVWNYTAGDASRSSLQGMAFYHALSEQTTFKDPDELP